MSDQRRPTTVRARLTLWNLGVMLVVLAVYAAGVFAFVKRSASQALDERVRSDFQLGRGDVGAAARRHVHLVRGRSGAGRQPWLTSVGARRRNCCTARRSPSGIRFERARSWRRQADGRIVAVPTAKTTFRVLSGHSRLDGRPVVIQVAQVRSRRCGSELRELLLFLAARAAAGGAPSPGSADTPWRATRWRRSNGWRSARVRSPPIA